ATTTASYVPVAGDWLNETVNLKPFLPAGTTSFSVSFTGKNHFGQKLYLDNINLKVSKLRRRDAGISRIIDPFSRLCTRTFTPLVEFVNKGIDTLKTLKLNYSINGGPVTTVNWTGSLLNGAFLTQAFAAVTVPAAGTYTFKAYTSEPNGLADQYLPNDTLVTTFTVFDAVPGPIVESFEQGTFPPANWAVTPSNAKYTWERTTRAASQGTASAWMRNRVYNASGAKDDLFAPLVQLTNVDSVFLTFDVAHMTARFPGSTAVNLDTLEVLLTQDCGKTFRSIYKKWGEDLQSVREPNFPGVYNVNDTIAFVPTNKNQWRTDSINLTPLTGTTGQFQLVFRNINNYGNNTFLDNINIRPLTLPAKLKAQGYMISPNPSEGMVYVNHYIRPTNLRGIQVINPAGQIVWQKQFSGNAQSNIPVDLTRFAAGIYTFRLMYDNKVITQRVIKTK
ncbi:MAG: T9SS type A sorting domain-containing protein, partial [Gemmatimonadaceae bacterium]|nr:T9SS type A sorting domain-containing protein [Chitinophagaceae bacterium]